MVQTGFEEYSIFYNQTQTYEITNFSNGLIKDIIETISLSCNFTYEIHIRQDLQWGTVSEFPNGTVVASGMYESLLDDSGKSSSFYLFFSFFFFENSSQYAESILLKS